MGESLHARYDRDRGSSQLSDPSPNRLVTGGILAGGAGRRYGGADKGLIELEGVPLIQRITARLRPQVGQLLISANRNLERYREFAPVVVDPLPGYQGPLAGLLALFEQTQTPLLAVVPCDNPDLPLDLVARLEQRRRESEADIAVARSVKRTQWLHAVLKRELAVDLARYLNQGERRVGGWIAQQRWVEVEFSADNESFENLNSPTNLMV